MNTGVLINKKRNTVISRLFMDRWLYIIMLPGLFYFIAFKYIPMLGIIIAFKNYQPYLGFLGSKWIGFDNFRRFFTDYTFFMLFRNTLIMALQNLIFFFPMPIILSLLLNEARKTYFKRFVQTLIYIPHFMSWVVVVGICYIMFTTQGGVVNEVIKSLGGQQIDFLTNARIFRPMIVLQSIWKETGWGTIIFLAALAGVDPGLYEASYMDGASRWQQLWHITFPAIKSTIVILLILRLGSFLDSGFEQIYLMLNGMNREVGEVFDTYVYTAGIQQGNFSYSAAVGLFKSVIGLILVVISNTVAKKIGEEGIY